MHRHQRRLRGLVIAAFAVMLVLSQLSVAAAQPPQSDNSNKECAGRGIPDSKIGIQQFTYLPALFSGPVEDVIAHMSEVGMRNVERFGGTFGLTLEEYAALWDQYQVRPVASHGSLNLNNWDQTLATAKVLNQKYVGSGGFGGPGFGSLEDTLQTAENLNELGRRAHQQGLRVFGHNHDDEFFITYPYDIDGDGDTEETSVIEILLAETDPRWVFFEIDVYWARDGIAERDGHDVNDPVNQATTLEFLEKYADRIPLMHVKDTAENGSITEVGQGTTDWAAVFRAADQVKYYFIEYDFPPDPFFTAENGFEFLSCITY